MQIRSGSKQKVNDPEGWYGAGHHCSQAMHFSAPFVHVGTLEKMTGHKDNYLLRLHYRTLCSVLASVEKEAFMVLSLYLDSLDCFPCSCKYRGRKL